MLLQAPPTQLLQAGALAKGVDGDPEPAVARADLDTACLGAFDAVGELLAGIIRIRSCVAAFHVDGEIVGCAIEVAGRAYALRHAVDGAQTLTAIDLSAARSRGDLVAVLGDGRNVELWLEHPFARLHVDRACEHLAAGVLPHAAHGDAKVDDMPGHDETAAQLGKLLVAQLDRLQRVAGLGANAGGNATGSQ
ncbi:hypothetical protein D3C84_859400 [compost metagenome]